MRRKRLNLLHSRWTVAFLSAVPIGLGVLLFAVEAASQAGPDPNVVNERNLRDVVLGRRTVTSEELTELDLNGDGKVDVADLAKFLREQQPVRRLVGTMVFDSEAATPAKTARIMPSQSISIRLRPADGMAVFKAEDSPLFPAEFAIPYTLDDQGLLTLSFPQNTPQSFPADDARNPLGRLLSWTINFTPAPVANGVVEIVFAMEYSGIRKDSEKLLLRGTMHLVEQESDDETQLFEGVGDIRTLVQRYGLQ